MSRGKKHKARSAGAPKRATPEEHDHTISDLHRRLANRLLVFNISGSIFMISCLPSLERAVQGDYSKLLKPIPPGWFFFIIILFIASLVARAYLVDRTFSLRHRLLHERNFAPNYILLQAVLSAPMIALPTVAVIYVSGATIPLAEFILNSWKFLSSWIPLNALNGIASLTSWIISGIVGNFAYDVVKRIFSNSGKK